MAGLPRPTSDVPAGGPDRPDADAGDQVSIVPNPETWLGFLIVSNPDADLRRIARLRVVAMGVRLLSRLLMFLAFCVALPLILGTISFASRRVLPPWEYAYALGVLIALVLGAIGTWWLSSQVERRRRILASIDGVDRNPPRVF